jgi:hypothetical protein
VSASFRVLLLAVRSARMDAPFQAGAFCRSLASRLASPRTGARFRLAIADLSPQALSAPRSAGKAVDAAFGARPSAVVVAAEAWHEESFAPVLHRTRLRAGAAPLLLAGSHVDRLDESLLDRLPGVDVLLQGDPAESAARWLSACAREGTSPASIPGTAVRTPAGVAARSRAQGRAAPWWRPGALPRHFPLLPFVLEHARTAEPHAAGSAEAWSAAFDLAPISSIRAQIAAAVRDGASEIAVRSPLLNPTAEHGEAVARAFARCGPDLAIPFARWLPHGPHGDAAKALVRRVRRLELDFPGASPGSASLLHPSCRPEAVASTLEWLRSAGANPVLCVWCGARGDDAAAVLETLRRAYSLRPSRVAVRSVAAPPGSWLHRNRERL